MAGDGGGSLTSLEGVAPNCQNAAQPSAKAEGCVRDDLRADKLRKGWGFRVGTWNVDSLTERAGELVEALADREVDVGCEQGGCYGL